MCTATNLVKSSGVSLDGPCRTLVVAGHYCLNPDLEDLSSDQETEEASFAHGAEVVRDALDEGGYSKLILWVNDIGITAEERARIKMDYSIPDNYRQVLHRTGLGPEHVEVRFEGAMRNRASTALRQMAARKPHLFRKVPSSQQGLVRCIDACSIDTQERDAYVIDGPNSAPLVVKEGPNPKCNLILATLFNRITSDHKPDAIINIFNNIYINRIALGIHVNTVLFDSTVRMVNLFCDGEDILEGAGPSWPTSEPAHAAENAVPAFA